MNLFYTLYPDPQIHNTGTAKVSRKTSTISMWKQEIDRYRHIYLQSTNMKAWLLR